jgi:glycosyltransferase involved in cell wall biosynthesis
MMMGKQTSMGPVPHHTLTLVVPCYNEELTLAHCIERVLELRSEQLKLEIIIVDDCSKDTSLEVAQELERKHPEIRVLHHEVNQGKGAALRTGFAHATGDFVGIQDADLEYEPLEYRKLLEPLLRDEVDVVFGSRYLRPNSRKVLYFWHSWMNKTLTFVSNMMTNLDISDMETCYKLFRREIIQSIDLKENRFGFEPEVVAKIAQRHCRVWEEAISYRPRSFEEGKKIGWKDGVRALYCILHYSAHTAQLPMQLLLYLFIGGISAVGNILFFSILMAANVNMTAAVVVAFAGAAWVNYLLCVSILFRHNARWNTWGEILMYLLTVLIMGAFDVGLTMNLAYWGLSPLTSKTFATIFGFIGNFVLRKYLVFPEKSIAG